MCHCRKSTSTNNSMPSKVLLKIEEEIVITGQGGIRSAVLRGDGTATAWYRPGRQVAVTIERKACATGDEWSIYAAHITGEVALNFSFDGAGFVNYPPPSNGAPYLSLRADGSGRILSPTGVLERDWGPRLEPQHSSSNEGLEPRDVKLGRRLSQHLGVRFTPRTRCLEVFLRHRGVHLRFVRGPNNEQTFRLPAHCDLFGRPKPQPSPQPSLVEDGPLSRMTISEAVANVTQASLDAADALRRARKTRGLRLSK